MHDFSTDTPRQVIETLDIGIALLDRDHRILVWNDWLAAMSGVRADWAVGRTFENVFSGHSFDTLNGAISSAFESGVATLLTHSLHPTLIPLKTRANKRLIHDVRVGLTGRGESAACLVQVVDVTVSSDRARVLRQRQEARYDAVVDSAPDAILTLDADGTIQIANPAAQRQFGYEAGELIGQTFRALFPEVGPWAEAFRTVVNGGVLQQPVEMTARRKDGTSSFLELSLSRWSSESRSFVTAILRDVNDRHAAEEARNKAAEELAKLNATLEQRVAERTAQLMEAEEALRQSAKMEAIGQLTGGIAHDFNNLLQGIIGALDRIKSRIANGRITDVDKFLKGALESANRAAALTHRLLVFSRRQPIDPRPIKVRDLILSMEELLRRSIGEATTMKIHAPDDLWVVRCDSNQLENALLNLAINARDAMPGGGTLTIDTENVVLDGLPALKRELDPGEYLCIRVRDTGVGMTPDVAARAFDPFYTTKPIGQGTGLGLSMIYGFVRQSDGSVRIDSAIGHGTTVEILLPRYDGEVHQEVFAETEAGSHSGQNEVVLVVEDEAVVRFLIVELLHDLGYRALEAADGSSALKILQSPQRIDLLVSDIGLPGLNGRQLADAARAKRPELKILLMTGYAENAAAKSFLGTGMEMVVKPFEMDAMSTKIRKMIDSNGRVLHS